MINDGDTLLNIAHQWAKEKFPDLSFDLTLGFIFYNNRWLLYTAKQRLVVGSCIISPFDANCFEQLERAILDRIKTIDREPFGIDMYRGWTDTDTDDNFI